MDSHEMLYWIEAIGTIYKRDHNFLQRWWWDLKESMDWKMVNELIRD